MMRKTKTPHLSRRNLRGVRDAQELDEVSLQLNQAVFRAERMQCRGRQAKAKGSIKRPGALKIMHTENHMIDTPVHWLLFVPGRFAGVRVAPFAFNAFSRRSMSLMWQVLLREWNFDAFFLETFEYGVPQLAQYGDHLINVEDVTPELEVERNWRQNP